MGVLDHAIIAGLRRRAGQLADDPVLRRWLLARALGREKGPAAFTGGLPPYLSADDLEFTATAAAAKAEFTPLRAARPRAAIKLCLPGETIELLPGDEAALFTRHYDDLETMLAAQRFAWLPIMENQADPAWVDALWRAWLARHATPDQSWAWHPYTATERAINILDYAARAGLPGESDETIAVLARHAQAIAENLEYFGEHYTSNHLSNNGRGLYLIGLALGMNDAAKTGARIMLEEAKRIFLPSGMLREGSSHYHLLLTRNYASAWRAAENHERPEAEAFWEITGAALAVLPHIQLPGGMPLIGDISPDCPPDYLTELLNNHDLDYNPLNAEKLDQDGWVRFDHGPWSGLWHAARDGWPMMPGHGHQDIGGFELHYDDTPLFVDRGRGVYGDNNPDVSTRAHNSLVVDGQDAYPPNRPYYNDRFRREIGGEPPRLTREADGIELSHHGFERLKDIGAVTRNWRFTPDALTLHDRVEGRADHRVTRRLHTTQQVSRSGQGIEIQSGGQIFRLSADGDIAVSEEVCWRAYGEAVTSTVIDITIAAALPVDLTLTVERV